MVGMFFGTFMLVARIVLLIIALGVLFNSARVLRTPEGNYDSEARLSARIVFVIALVFAIWLGASLFVRIGAMISG